MRLLPFGRRNAPPPAALEEVLDGDIKGRPGIYIEGTVIPDRRTDRRPPPKSPGRRAEDPIDDPFPVPFVPRPREPAEEEPV